MQCRNEFSVVDRFEQGAFVSGSLHVPRHRLAHRGEFREHEPVQVSVVGQYRRNECGHAIDREPRGDFVEPNGAQRDGFVKHFRDA